MCKAGGRLYLFDVVFSFNIDEYRSCLDGWVKSIAEKIGPAFGAEAKTHLREEYSTFDWVMEGMFERAGFAIEKADYKNEFMVAYLCTRKGERT
jgi:hypothetical protein